MERLAPPSTSERREFARLGARWAVLGSTARGWAIAECAPARPGVTDVTAFLASGQSEVGRVAKRLAELGAPLGGVDALDFGCGPGRMSQALAARYQNVHGLDLAREMVDLARSLLPEGVRCTFDRSTTPDLAGVPSESFDLVFCVYVLQHLPAWLVRRYLTDFARVLRPGGIVVLQFHSALASSALRWVPSRVASPVVNPLRRAWRRVRGRPVPWDDYWMRPDRVAGDLTRGGLTVLAMDRAQRSEGRMQSHWLYGCRRE